MTSAVIVSAVRTAIGTAFKGSLRDTPAEEMAKAVLEAAVQRSGLAPELVDDVILAESLYGGGAVARHAAIEAGLVNAGGQALNRHCAGSLSSVGVAAGSIMAGMDQAIVAGGVMSTSMGPQMSWRAPGTTEYVGRWMPPTHPNTPDAPNNDMTITVGWNTAKAADLSREEMDAWALRSHDRAIAAIDAGQFDNEIVPVRGINAEGENIVFQIDEHPRRGSKIEKLASLKPLHPEIEGFPITAGNSSGMNDAASAMMMVSDGLAKSEGLETLAKVRSWAAVGIDPRLTGMAVLDVIPKVLARAGVSQSDVALWEINEAFASVPIAACKKLGIDDAIVNTAGSGCSLGHPVAASGARMITTLIHDLRKRGGGIGVAAMCAGGGQAGAVLIEV